jgi:hypothetical protein
MRAAEGHPREWSCSTFLRAHGLGPTGYRQIRERDGLIEIEMERSVEHLLHEGAV